MPRRRRPARGVGALQGGPSHQPAGEPAPIATVTGGRPDRVGRREHADGTRVADPSHARRRTHQQRVGARPANSQEIVIRTTRVDEESAPIVRTPRAASSVRDTVVRRAGVAARQRSKRRTARVFLRRGRRPRAHGREDRQTIDRRKARRADTTDRPAMQASAFSGSRSDNDQAGSKPGRNAAATRAPTDRGRSRTRCGAKHREPEHAIAARARSRPEAEKRCLTAKDSPDRPTARANPADKRGREPIDVSRGSSAHVLQRFMIRCSDVLPDTLVF